MSSQSEHSSFFAASESLGSIDYGTSRTNSSRSLKNIGAYGAMLLLRGLFRRIIRKGTLTVIAPDGRADHIGSGMPSLTIRIVDPAVILRLATNPDLAIGEAYMDGGLVIEDGDIYDFLDLCFANLGWSNGRGLRRLRASVKHLVRQIAQHNPIPVARSNVAHHYDLSDTLYELFLDADRQYSCAYFISRDDTLECAQEQKKRHLAAKLLLRPGQRVLDIGSG